MPPAPQELLCHGKPGCVTHSMHHTLPLQCHSTQRHSSGQGLAAQPPQRPLVSPGQQGSGMSHVRLLQRLAGDTLNVL